MAYVRFVGADEAVSASTDSTLRLWDLSSQACRPAHLLLLPSDPLRSLLDQSYCACA